MLIISCIFSFLIMYYGIKIFIGTRKMDDSDKIRKLKVSGIVIFFVGIVVLISSIFVEVLL